MRLKLPASLHYPLTVRRIEKRVGDEINPRDLLFTYTYTVKVTQQEKYSDEDIIVDKLLSSHFQSTIEGTIQTWLVWEGDIINGPREICEVEEPCKHSVQFGGLCVECGKDMTGIDMAGEDLASRANIQGAHDSDKLLISQEEANDIDQESKRRLLAARKLSLVVDLDQTIIHAAVDPTIGEWQKDPDNPNYEALKDVRAFQLLDDAGSKQECWYYIKLRPGLEEFLESIAEKYELHVYTMGTRQYATKIAEIVDPNHKYFGDRILSRDESGSMHAKNLTRLFPVDTRMVVIIDDRADVWKWSPNLIRVSQFEFFAGIGDINAGFLPKRQDVPIAAKLGHPQTAEEHGNGASEAASDGQKVNGEVPAGADAGTDTTALQQVMTMTQMPGAADSKDVQSQDQVIASQLEEKPLLKLQRQMDEKDGIDATHPDPTSTQNTDSDSSDSDTLSNSGKKRHSVLRNDDEELVHLERSLLTVHEKFFTDYDRKRNSTGKGGRVAALAGKSKAPIPNEKPDMRHVPDVKQIIPALKQHVLAGVVIVFSSVVPLKTDIQTADISLWAKSFGAVIHDKVSRDTTHLVAARVGTAKVKNAVKKGIKVVSTDWLLQSIQRWKKLDERPFMLKGIGQKEMPKDPSSDEMAPDVDMLAAPAYTGLGEAELSSDEDTSALIDTDENEDDQPRKKRPKLDLQDLPQADEAEDGDDPLESPTNISAEQWSEMDEELREFMGSDIDSESDAESVKSDRSNLSLRRKKRNRDDDDGDGDGDESGVSDGERRNGDGHVSKRPRSSALRAVKNAESTRSSTPNRETEQTQEEYDAELEAELERELEAADNE